MKNSKNLNDGGIKMINSPRGPFLPKISSIIYHQKALGIKN